MDFLDPRSKRRHAIRLMIGYGLVSIMIFTASTILVFKSYGFDVDRKTGAVIQNGLVFVDSAPDKATIMINGKEYRDQTNTRIALPEGRYDLTIKKDGYRDWNRSFMLQGGSIQRFTYPLLIKGNLEQQEIANFSASKPTLTTQSPDRRWVLFGSTTGLTNFTEYDLRTVNVTTERPAERSLTFPADLYTPTDAQQSLELVEWSTDNDHVLVKHSYAGAVEFVILSREKPETSFNITKLLGESPKAVVLRDKKFDQWYIHRTDGTLLTANSKKELATVASGVGVFKSHDSSTLLYSLMGVDSDLETTVMIRQGSKTYQVRKIAKGAVQLDIARYEDAWYTVIASDADKKTYIYKDPVDFFGRVTNTKPTPAAILKSAGGAFSTVGFSQNTRFIVAQSGQHFETYDAEEKETYRYNVAQPLDEGFKTIWMDGHRLIGQSLGNMLVFDFDGSNAQTYIGVLPGSRQFFDRDYTVLYSLNNSAVTKDTIGMIRTDLRFEQDK